MPELPEVEVVLQQIRPVLQGQTVIKSRMFFHKLRYPIELPPEGCVIKNIFRRNKYLILELEYLQAFFADDSELVSKLENVEDFKNNKNIKIKNKTLFAIWHLGMSGQFRYFSKNNLKNNLKNNSEINLDNLNNLDVDLDDPPLQKHEHVELQLGLKNINNNINNNIENINNIKNIKDYVKTGILRYHDPRRFGCLLMTDDWQNHKLIKDLGIEPLGFNQQKAITAAELAKYCQKIIASFKQETSKNMPAKKFLMNGKYIVGIGNIYASEILFASGVHPEEAIKNISAKKWLLICQNTQNILQKAIEQGGSTLHDFVDIDGNHGQFQQTHQVYQRHGKICYTENCGQLIEKIIQEQRSTFFCAKCQPKK